LQSFPFLSIPPSVKDWSETNVPTDTCVGMIRRSVSKLEATLREMIDKLSESGRDYDILLFVVFKKHYSMSRRYEPI